MHLTEHPAGSDAVSRICAEARQLLASGTALADLPPDVREVYLDVEVIKHGPAIQAALRDRAIAAAPNVINFADAKAKLPRGI